ncbi:type 2 lantipeptide synthetase LanM family protein [Clostridium perfringens]|uniref:type 2 lanthipeptide synthetase LanM family protein n=1 Tax=Clostridium perfringens TaxID=1502 RepID=UPI0022487095|nr:type 2 lanthipeptide synthetase LanM family protein [Clostridium perfringens]MCX0386937.1 type 2 lantipeptide synthetase LanM family protein [Clostridium perfringens]
MINETINKENVVNYWKSFFQDNLTNSELNDMLKSVSNMTLEESLNNYYMNININLNNTFIYNTVTNEKITIELLNKLQTQYPWTYLYEPIIKKYIDNYIYSIDNCKVISNSYSFLFQTLSSLITQLNSISYQTIIAETFYAKNDNLLKGQTSEERGTYFSNVLLKDNSFRKNLFSNYPELARILDLKTNYVLNFISKILKDTEKELSNIEAKLFPNISLGTIDEIYLNQGDTHNHGQTVAKLIFSSKKKLIYKPHSLKVDQNFSKFINWLNQFEISENSRDKLKSLKIYTTQNCGWVKFVDYKECLTLKNVSDFYYKTGKILCLLYTLNGNDMHSENIIANGEFPMLIDLETIIHPNISKEYYEDNAIGKCLKELKESVNSTLLLPSKVINYKNNKSLDIGGLTYKEEQLSPFKSKFIENIGRDDVKITEKYGTIKAKNNCPSFNGKKEPSYKYKNEIILGFKDTYKWILQNKKIYISKICSYFKDSKVRALYGPTNVYAQLLNTSFHPDLLTNSIDRYIFLHRIALNYKNKNTKLISCEIKNLMQCDIPYFSQNIDNNIVNNIDSDDIIINENITSLSKIKEKVNEMNINRLYRQIHFINTSFMDENYSGHIRTSIKLKDQDNININFKHFENIAIKIGDYLLDQSIVGGPCENTSRTWFSTEHLDLNNISLLPMTPYLYNGLSGMLLFFNSLWIITKNHKYRNVSQEIIISILEYLDFLLNPKNLSQINTSAFLGIGSIAYSLFYVDYYNKTDLYIEKIYSIIDVLNLKINEPNKTLDVINYVGNIGIFISIYNKTENNVLKNKSLNICKKIFEILKSNTIKIPNTKGISWSSKGYVGYSHGNSGVISQLYRLYDVLKDNEILKLIDLALIYERFMYSSENQNWYKCIDEKNFNHGWCHGAPGILLSKIQMKKLGYNDSIIDNEILIALNQLINNGLGHDISLCHGDLGNISILKDAALYLNKKTLFKHIISTLEDISSSILDLLNQESFKENEHNAFMIGLPGIGYELLRIGRESELPNILSLE